MFVCPLAENLKIVNLQGKLKSNKKLSSELSFDFCIGSVGKYLIHAFVLYLVINMNKNMVVMVGCCMIVCLQDSVLAFWKHGMQGKSFKSNEV